MLEGKQKYNIDEELLFQNIQDQLSKITYEFNRYEQESTLINYVK